MDSCTSSAVSWGNIPQFPAVCHTSLAAKVIVQRKELKYKGQATTFLSVHQIAPYLIVTAKNKTALWFHLTADLAPGKWHNQLLMPKHSEIYNQYSSPTTPCHDIMDGLFTVSDDPGVLAEVKWSVNTPIQKLRYGCSAGSNGIPPELLKCAINPVSIATYKPFLQIWSLGHVLTEWKEKIIY